MSRRVLQPNNHPPPKSPSYSKYPMTAPTESTNDVKPIEQTESKEQAIENRVEQAKRAFALRKFEEAIDHYATALELMTALHGDGAPESADLLFSYGKTLLENAIAQAGVVGKEETEGALRGDDKDSGTADAKTSGRIHFSGDGEEEKDDETVDLLGKTKKGTMEVDGEGDDDDESEGGDEEEEGEPEDDFNAAWEVLELARSLYEKQDGEEAKLKLADSYIALGDVSLETEKFDQAATDYAEGLRLKTELLPFHSRQIAEAHYRLSMVLDLTPGKLSAAIEHSEKALKSVESKLEKLRDALSSAPETAPEVAPESDAPKKAKGKAKSVLLVDAIDGLSKSQVEAQIKEFEELKADLALKVEDLKTVPESAAVPQNAQDAANTALDELLNAKPVIGSAAEVKDITSMVKKKKKPVEDSTNNVSASASGAPGKRKADEAADQMEKDSSTPITSEKRVKLDDDVQMESSTAPAPVS